MPAGYRRPGDAMIQIPDDHPILKYLAEVLAENTVLKMENKDLKQQMEWREFMAIGAATEAGKRGAKLTAGTRTAVSARAELKRRRDAYVREQLETLRPHTPWKLIPDIIKYPPGMKKLKLRALEELLKKEG